jgi:hypothetical protein
MTYQRFLYYSVLIAASMQTSGISHLLCRTATVLGCCVSCGHSCSSLQKWHWSDNVSDIICNFILTVMYH